MQARILVVDDSAVSAQFFKNILERENYFVITAHDGRNIVELIEAHRVDIILLDVIMPKMDGYKILRNLQESESAKDIPVIMITSLSSPLEVKKALDCGALDFIRKTAEAIEVIARVNSALRFKLKQDQLKHNSQRDHLTQLYNKQFFNETLERLICEKANFPNGISLLIMDCDFFKRINDQYGHTSGDVVLAKISNAMVKSVKSSDFVCRFGGEEFCVIFPNATLLQAYSAAERIRTNIQKIPFNFNGQDIYITISCGVSHTDCNDNKTGLKLVNEADSALYQAKSDGRNQTAAYSRRVCR